DVGILSPHRGPDGRTVPLPTGYEKVQFIESASPHTPAGRRACELDLEVEWKTKPDHNTELHFWQWRTPDASPDPVLAMRAHGAQLRVQLYPVSSGGSPGPGCWKSLHIG